MRDAFAKELTRLAGEDERIVLLSGDIGNRMFDDFKRRCPGRFFNCGVAEANMTGVAAGLALAGLRPLTYTITPFVTTRCLEQIRVDLCYHNLPVVVVAVGAGYAYASLGATHHACEDIAFLRSLPNMTVVCPGDAREVRQALGAALAHDSPVYLRLGKKGEPVVHEQDPRFEIGKGLMVREGDDLCLLSTGNTLPLAVEAADLLERNGRSTQVVSLHTVKPLDVKLLEDVFTRFPVVATLEEHSLIGGAGAAVAEWLVDRERPAPARLLRLGTPDRFPHNGADQGSLRAQCGLTAVEIAAKLEAGLGACV